MMLRSSSTPVLGSLLSSFSENPNNNHYQSDKDTPTSINQKLSCGSQHYPKSLWHSSPSTSSQRSPSGFRRVQSDGNLEELANVSYNVDEFSFSNVSKKFARKPNCFGLERISSLNLGTCREDEDSDEDEDENEGDVESIEENQIKVHHMHVKEEMTSVNKYDTLMFEAERKMYLATGLGVADISYFDGDGPVGGGNGGNGGGGGGNYRPVVAFDRDGGDSRGGLGMEEHHKNMLEESPNNPLFLRNYAQFLYQTKGDLEGAEEYYSRAILADPGDGEILSQYAKLVWELHRDEDRATSYFERAVQASSHDSQIQAAYANFLWEIEDEDQDEASKEPNIGPPPFHSQAMASATA